MAKNNDIHPNAPAGGGGPGAFRSAAPMGTTPDMDKWMHPGPLGTKHKEVAVTLKISGVIVAGGPLSQGTITAVNKAAEKTPLRWRHYVAYADKVKVGGSLAWRANNPGNLRNASTKIGTVPGAVGHFAVFASMEDGREAQRSLYVNKYGNMKVEDEIKARRLRECHEALDNVAKPCLLYFSSFCSTRRRTGVQELAHCSGCAT